MHLILVSVHSTVLQANAVRWVPSTARIILTNLLLSDITFSIILEFAIRAGDLSISL